MIKLGTNKRLHERLLLHLVKSPWPNFPVLYSVNTIHRSALNVDLSLETESLMWALSGELFQGGRHHLHLQRHRRHHTLHLHNNHLTSHYITSCKSENFLSVTQLFSVSDTITDIMDSRDASASKKSQLRL